MMSVKKGKYIYPKLNENLRLEMSIALLLLFGQKVRRKKQTNKSKFTLTVIIMTLYCISYKTGESL